jgi:hypothetical protein
MHAPMIADRSASRDKRHHATRSLRPWKLLAHRRDRRIARHDLRTRGDVYELSTRRLTGYDVS